MCYGDNEDCTVDCSTSRRRRSALRSARDTASENTDHVPMQENGLPDIGRPARYPPTKIYSAFATQTIVSDGFT